MKKQGLKILAVALIALVGVNTVFLVLTMRANHGAARAYQERHALISAVYESSIAGGAFTRLARYFAMVGDNSDELFHAEAERNRYGRTLDTFIAFGAPSQEIELMKSVTEQRLLLFGYLQEVIRLRQEGYIKEAITLAHGPAVSRIGMPAGPMSDAARDLICDRTSRMALDYQRMAEIFGNLTIIGAVILVWGSLAWLILAGKVGMPRMVEVFGAVFLIIAFVGMFLSVLANISARNKLDVHGQQYALVNAIYNAERGTEILTRLSRMYVVTGGATQYNQYFEELERDRFGAALDIFILMNAKSSEINVLVDVLGRLTMLRQIESQSMLLRSSRYPQEAIEIAFGPEVAALDGPLGILGEELREAVNARTQRKINVATRNRDMFVFAAIISALLLAAAGFGKLLALKYARQETAPGIVALTFRRITDATIRVKLFSSFAIVIILFIAQIGISTYFDMRINSLSRNIIDFLMGRSEILWAYHQEFTEMRRLMVEISLSPECPDATDEVERHITWQRLSASHARLTYLREAYEMSIMTDPIFPKTHEDSRIVILTEVMSYVDTIYELYRTNFFLPRDMRVCPNDTVIDYTDSAEILLRMLRQFVNVNHETAEKMIESYRYISIIVIIASLIAAVVLASLLAFSTLRAFTSRIKDIEATADKVVQGDFETSLQGGTDEISAVLSKLVGVFTGLIGDINDVTDENKKGNLNARIDTSHFQGGYKDAALAINALLDAVAEMQDQKEKMLVAQENSMAKSKFLARMSHEIRTPISAVLGISEIQMHNPALPLEIEEAFAKIHSSSSILLSIVNDILDLSKIEAGKFDIIASRYEVASFLSDVLQLNTLYLDSKKLGFVVNVDENIPSFLIGDDLRIKQILNNVLSNAFKYTNEGFVYFAAYCKDENAGRVNLVFIIRDTGQGMDPEQLKALFDEYSRFNEKENRFVAGTGLGMSIASSLLKLMNATIDVQSEKGKGTTVTIVLPQEIGSDKVLGFETTKNLQDFKINAHSTAKRLSFKPEPMPYGRVLVVDDVDTNIYVAKGLMSLYELQIDTCDNGFTALEKIKSGEVYDIIFMDYMMPKMNGMETAACIRDLGYTQPIVVLTANAIVGQAEEFLRSGFDGFLSKPIVAAHLDGVLHKFIKGRHNAAVVGEISAENANTESMNIDEYFDNYLKSSGTQEKMYRDFARSQKNTMAEIENAVQANDMQAAHHLAHELKGLAGLIRETTLMEIAQKTESALREGHAPANLLDALGIEMEIILAKIKAQYPDVQNNRQADINFDKTKASEIFDRVVRLLKENSFEAVQLCDELATIPQTDELIRQIEDVDFGKALQTIENLRKILEA
ncbi:MAG: ATP-binding protein [Treponema sp.]|nr:ATP-binding protein [Treponema sp.]